MSTIPPTSPAIPLVGMQTRATPPHANPPITAVIPQSTPPSLEELEKEFSNVDDVDFLRCFFELDEKINFVIFDDRSYGFGGAKKTTNIAEYTSPDSSIRRSLHWHNRQNRCISVVVNSGGFSRDDITKINAQYVECDDLSFEEQLQNIWDFPLRPSIIVRTRRSLHVYWLISDGDVSRFENIQKKLVKQFTGDPACTNVNRAMRMPGYMHCKSDPIEVKTVWFKPELRYTQDQLAAQLSPLNEKLLQPASTADGQMPGLNRVLNCEFLTHCRGHADTLPEPLWQGMITVLADFTGGIAKIHELSAPHPKYNENETNRKIQLYRTAKSTKGIRSMRCDTLIERGFDCPARASGKCKCSKPADLATIPLSKDDLYSLIERLPVEGDTIDRFSCASAFIDEYIYDQPQGIANILIKTNLKSHFDFSAQEIKDLQSHYSSIAKTMSKTNEEKNNDNNDTLPSWYELSEDGTPILRTGLLADYLAAHLDIFCLGGSFYRYENGVYSPISDVCAHGIIRKHLIARYAKSSQIKDVETQWGIITFRDYKDINSSPDLLNLTNGMYDVADDNLLEHNPSYYSTIQLNVPYTLDAECPRFLEFLDSALPDDQIPLVQEIMGYLLVPVSCAQKAFVLVGAAGTGKSVLLRIISDVLLGSENVSNVSWHDLEGTFRSAELFGKLANIFADLPAKALKDTAMFKALVGEDTITAEKKFKNPFTFQNRARLMFSCNQLPPNYSDRSNGLGRRLIIIRMDHVVPKDRIDPNLFNKLKSEGAGILQFALDGLRRLMRNGYRFSETQRNLDELTRYRRESDSVLSFLEDCCETDSSYSVGSTELYQQYRSYCTAEGAMAVAHKRFITQIKSHYPQVNSGKDSTGSRRILTGIRIGTIIQ